MKMVAPDHIGHLNFDNVEYERGDDGMFEIQHPDHVASAKIHGLLPYDPEAQAPVVPVAERVPSDFDEINAKLIEDHERTMAAAAKAKQESDDEKDARIATLEEQLAAAQATTTADDAEKASDDTSEDDGGTAATEAAHAERVAAALALNPNFDEMGRDQLVEWLSGVDVETLGNVSKDAARAEVDAIVAAHTESK